MLVVEDDEAIRRFVRLALEAEGFRVAEAATCARGVIDAGTRKPDLAIVDLGLPDRDGTEFIREVRAYSALPIVVLSARDDERQKIAALDAGADDYLTKPFGVGELVARMRAMLRRSARTAENESPEIRFGEIRLDVANHVVERGGAPLKLTPVEFRLLAHLAVHPGKVLTHRHLLREVWGPSHVEHGHYLRVYMQRLRSKIEADPARPRHLVTETGVGYRFVP